MSDSNQWQSPDQPAAPSGGGFPPPPGPGFAPGPGQGGQPGWTPPPKPGLIPLQPMTLGTILAGSFQVMRRNPRPTFGISLVINGIVAVVSLVTVGLVVFFAFDRVATASSSTIDDITAGSTAITLLAGFVEVALGLVGGAILQGIISLEVARATVGEKLRLRELWSLAKGRVGALIGWSFIAGGLVIAGVAVLTVIVVVLIATLGTAGIVAGVLVGLFGLAGFAVLVAWIGTRVSLVPSVLLLERTRLIPAIRRSWELTTGFFWRTFGIQLLVTVIVTTASQIVLVPVTLVLTVVIALTNPNADPNVIDNSFYITMVITTLATSLIGSVTAIITSATSSLIYIDLRMRKEGLDLSLTRFVEARQAGDRTVADPYLVSATSVSPRNEPGHGQAQDGPRRGDDPRDGGNTPPSDSPWA